MVLKSVLELYPERFGGYKDEFLSGLKPTAEEEADHFELGRSIAFNDRPFTPSELEDRVSRQNTAKNEKLYQQQSMFSAD